MEHFLRLPKSQRWAPRIYKIGLTGGIGNGKSSALHVIGNRHVTLGNPLRDSLVHEFGSDILLRDGNINRPMLARKVFSAPKNLQMLNELIWPTLLHCVKEAICAFEANGNKIICIEAAMMVEMGLAKHMDEIWVFGCTENIAIPRLLRRGSYYMEARQRIDSQIPLQERVKYADLVIDTSAPIELNQQIIKSRLKEIEANIWVARSAYLSNCGWREHAEEK